MPTYLGEMAPAQIRGRALSLNQLLISVGLLASYLVNWAFADSGLWRAMFGVGAIPSVLLILAALWLPESPTWLIVNGRRDDARKILDDVTEPGGADKVISRVGGPGRDSGRQREGTGSGSGRIRALLAERVRPALWVAVILAALQQFVGINTILYYAPTIMQGAGLSASNAIHYSVFIGIVNVIITVVSMALVDRVGRRPLLICSLAGMGISIALLGVAFAVGLNPLIMLVFMMLYILAFGIGMGPVFWVLLGEIFPPAQHAEGAGAGSTVNRLSNFLVSLAFLPVVTAIGQATTFWIFAVICVAGVVFVARRVPETRGRNVGEVGEDLHRRWNVRPE
ncbi:sugar porter family MFS transporter [Nonomuraea wenchangensis]|uniref:sugar porter family MFS transporter n=1 Tax=Nonomuraea wenchangensis TaxID=568860 RepID=UPI00341F472B